MGGTQQGQPVIVSFQWLLVPLLLEGHDYTEITAATLDPRTMAR